MRKAVIIETPQGNNFQVNDTVNFNNGSGIVLVSKDIIDDGQTVIAIELISGEM